MGGRRIFFEPRTLLDPTALLEQLRRVEGAPSPPVRKLTGKEWVEKARERRADEFHPNVMNITEAGHRLSEESKTAPDCAKPLSVGHCINLLRDLNVWSKKPRKLSRQRPK